MRTLLKVLPLVCVVSLLCLFSEFGTPRILHEASAQANPVIIGPNVVAYWTCDGKDVNGNTEVLKEEEIALSLGTVDLRVAGVALAIVRAPTSQGYNETPVNSFFTTRAAGTYRLWFRSYDQSDNVSAWSDPFTFDYKLPDTTPPTPPTGVGCKNVKS